MRGGIVQGVLGLSRMFLFLLSLMGNYWRFLDRREVYFVFCT